MPAASSKRLHVQSMSENSKAKSANVLEMGDFEAVTFFLSFDICFPDAQDYINLLLEAIYWNTVTRSIKCAPQICVSLKPGMCIKLNF